MRDCLTVSRDLHVQRHKCLWLQWRLYLLVTCRYVLRNIHSGTVLEILTFLKWVQTTISVVSVRFYLALTNMNNMWRNFDISKIGKYPISKRKVPSTMIHMQLISTFPIYS